MRNYSPKNKYRLDSVNRYYELLNYCRQYPEWKEKYKDCFGLRPPTPKSGRSSGVSDPTSRAVEEADKYLERMKTIERAAISADPELYRYIIINVTEGTPYHYISIDGCSPPCGRRQFYEKRCQFFWILDKIKKG